MTAHHRTLPVIVLVMCGEEPVKFGPITGNPGPTTDIAAAHSH